MDTYKKNSSEIHIGIILEFYTFIFYEELINALRKITDLFSVKSSIFTSLRTETDLCRNVSSYLSLKWFCQNNSQCIPYKDL